MTDILVTIKPKVHSQSDRAHCDGVLGALRDLKNMPGWKQTFQDVVPTGGGSADRGVPSAYIVRQNSAAENAIRDAARQTGWDYEAKVLA